MHATTAGPGMAHDARKGSTFAAVLTDLERLVFPRRPFDGTGGEGGQAGGNAGGGTGGDNPGDGSGTGNAGDDEGGNTPTDPEELARELARARSEAARFRQRAQAAEGKVQEHERAGQSELEQANARAQAAEERAAKLERKTRERDLADTVGDVARGLGFRNPARAHRLIDADGLMDDDGHVDTAEAKKRLGALLKEEPYLGSGSAAGAGDAGAGRQQQATGGGFNDAIRAAARGRRVAG